MRKLTLISVASLLSMAAFAEGYQVNLLSAKQTGMGHVGTAMKLGAESMHFNPAGMAFMEGSADFSVGGAAIFATATCKNNGIKYETDNNASTPLYAYAGFRIYDNLKGGISLTTPYGSGINWGKNWPGAVLAQDISMKAFTIQPTLSYKILDNLSIGAGLMMSWGNVNLSKGLISGTSFAAILPTWDSNVTPVSVDLKGDAHLRVGFNVGVMYDINEKVTLGASYRSKTTMKVNKGDAKLNYANDKLKPILSALLPNLDEAEFSAELPLPANLTLGVTYKPTDRWITSLDLQMTGWAAYQELNVVFPYVEYAGNEAPYENKSEKNYKNSFAVRLGGQYAVTERFDARAGFYFDQSPVRGDFYNPETPGMGKLGFSAGCSFRPVDGFSIDFALLYIQGISRTGSYTYLDPLLKKDVTFTGKYGTTAFAPTIGLSYKF